MICCKHCGSINIEGAKVPIYASTIESSMIGSKHLPFAEAKAGWWYGYFCNECSSFQLDPNDYQELPPNGEDAVMIDHGDSTI